MRSTLKVILASIATVLLVLPIAGCPGSSDLVTDTTNSTNTDNNTNNTDDSTNNTNNETINTDNTNNTNNSNNNNASGLTVVKTGITMHCQAGLLAGDNIIVYGSGTVTGVNYIQPGDAAGRGIPNGDTYSATEFAVAGNKIALVKDFKVTIFDTATGTSTAIPEADIRLPSVASRMYEVRNLHGSGNYFAVICDNSVADGKMIKAIDVSGATPVVVSFDVNPTDNVNSITQVAVDGNKVFVSVIDGKFFKYQVDQAPATPQEYPVLSAGGINSVQWKVSNGVILYRNDEGYPNAMLLDTANAGATPVKLTENPAGGALAIKAGKFEYLADRTSDDENGNHLRGAIGTVPGPGATLSGDTQIDGSTNNNNFVGWGQTTAITSDGAYYILAGWEAMGQGEYLQVSTGGAFTVVPDPVNTSEYGCPATDVDASAKIIAFKTGDSTSTSCDESKVGYIQLP